MARIPIEIVDEILLHLPVEISIALNRERPKRDLLRRTHRDSPANDMEHMEWLYRNGVQGLWPSETFQVGTLKEILWLEERYPWLVEDDLLNWITAEDAVEADDRDVLRHLCFRGHEEDLMDFAAASGRLGILKWMHANGARCTTRGEEATRNGVPDVITFLRLNRAAREDDKSAIHSSPAPSGPAPISTYSRR